MIGCKTRLANAREQWVGLMGVLQPIMGPLFWPIAWSCSLS